MLHISITKRVVFPCELYAFIAQQCEVCLPNSHLGVRCVNIKQLQHIHFICERLYIFACILCLTSNTYVSPKRLDFIPCNNTSTLAFPLFNYLALHSATFSPAQHHTIGAEQNGLQLINTSLSQPCNTQSTQLVLSYWQQSTACYCRLPFSIVFTGLLCQSIAPEAFCLCRFA